MFGEINSIEFITKLRDQNKKQVMVNVIDNRYEMVYGEDEERYCTKDLVQMAQVEYMFVTNAMEQWETGVS